MSLWEFPPQALRIFALVFGLVWGSFLNVVIYRVPRGLNVAHPPSQCPRCNTPIRPWQNIPVFSYLLLGGRSACCRARIPGRYPIVEIIGGVLSVAIVDVIILSLPAATPAHHALAIYLADLALALGLVAAAFIDVEHMLVPDSISIGGTVLGLATFGLREMSLPESAMGAAVGFVVVWLPFDFLYRKLRGQPGMGLGDAKLTMLAGAWFGPFGAVFVLCAGALQGTLVTLGLMLTGRMPEEPEAVRREREELARELETLSAEERAEVEAELALDPLAGPPESGVGKARIAFGPFLILATLECLLLGPDRILGWLSGT